MKKTITVCDCCGSTKNVCVGIGSLQGKDLCMSCFNALVIGRLLKYGDEHGPVDAQAFVESLAGDGFNSILMW
jgi:hypothetical protein